MPEIPKVTDEEIRKLANKYRKNKSPFACHENQEIPFRDQIEMLRLRKKSKDMQTDLIKNINKQMKINATDIKLIETEQLLGHY